MRLIFLVLAIISPAAFVAGSVPHWAFEPVGEPQLPQVRRAAWLRNPIDRFVLQRLEAEGLSPAPAADPRTLVRRATTGLTGLAPAYETVKTYRANPSEEAYAELLDQLLASPAYGERWGRHWLDVARYADTRGYLTGGEETRFPYSYTYRDYVIRAFNEDKPYDRFILEQLAADQLNTENDPAALAAMGFLTVGRRFLNKNAEIIDDRIDVVTRGFMGLTVYCARCHDHKYDPVPTEDYYSLYGIFDNSREPDELPVIEEPGSDPGYAKYKAEHDRRMHAVESLRRGQYASLKKELSNTVGDYLKELARQQYPDHFKGLPKPDYLQQNRLRRHALSEWRTYVLRRLERPDPVFSILPELAKIPVDGFAGRVGERIKTHRPILPVLRNRLLAGDPKKLDDVMNTFAQLWKAGEHPVFRAAFSAQGSPLHFPYEELQQYQDRKMREAQTKLEKKVVAWEASSPDAPARAMVLHDVDKPHANYVFLRGNSSQPGKQVARQFLQVLAGKDRKPYSKGSGRLELAQSIVDPENPLTYRVLVNRVWHYHFGRGLVNTPDDFGTRGDRPSHPDLLDYLAHWFVTHDKSIKQLHRLIMSSATYRQASVVARVDGVQDPDNRLLSRMSRQRLTLEAMRDQMMQAAGKLDRRLGGQSIELWNKPFSPRRAVYGFVDRQKVPDIFRTFDFANPDSVTGKRPLTTVPQQALFQMNSPFLMEMAAALAARSAAKQPDVRVRSIYRFALAREPNADEKKSARVFLAGGDEKRWRSFAQVLLMSNEFAFVD